MVLQLPQQMPKQHCPPEQQTQ